MTSKSPERALRHRRRRRAARRGRGGRAGDADAPLARRRPAALRAGRVVVCEARLGLGAIRGGVARQRAVVAADAGLRPVARRRIAAGAGRARAAEHSVELAAGGTCRAAGNRAPLVGAEAASLAEGVAEVDDTAHVLAMVLLAVARATGRECRSDVGGAGARVRVSLAHGPYAARHREKRE